MENITPVEESKAVKPKLTPVMDLIKKSVLLWWANIEKILLVYWQGIKYALIPMIVVLVAYFLAGPSLGENEAVRASAIFIIVTAAIISAYFAIRAYMAVYILVGRDYSGDAKDIFEETKDIFLPYIWLTILTGILIILWMLLLIIPGLVYSVLYSLAIYAFFFEGKRGMGALRRSLSLTKGYFWALVGRILSIGLLYSIFSSIISIPLSSMEEGSLIFYIWSVLVQIINFLVGPIAVIFSYLIYKDLVKIKQ